VLCAVILLYEELIYITFDEESAQVSGIPTRRINLLFIALVGLTVSLAIPIVGILLIGALIVIPVVSALQYKKGFFQTIIIAECLSVFSVVSGIIASFYFNISSGGTIVLVTLAVFIATLFINGDN
jgi:zinc transport system permease protein